MLTNKKGIKSMNRTPHKENKFSERWKRAGAETQRKIAGKPVARILWESAVRKDETFKTDSEHFDSQTAFAAWLQGWTEAEIQNQLRPNKPQAGSFDFKKGPRTPEEIDALRHKIGKLMAFSPAAQDMALFGRVHDDPSFRYAAVLGDVLDWVSGKISTEELLSENYLDIEHLRQIMKR
jgi:hypothetical protein